MLKKLAPTEKRNCSVRLKPFDTDISVLKNPEPRIVFRAKLPKPSVPTAKSPASTQGTPFGNPAPARAAGSPQLRPEGAVANVASGVPLRNPVTLPRLLRDARSTGDHGIPV